MIISTGKFEICKTIIASKEGEGRIKWVMTICEPASHASHMCEPSKILKIGKKNVIHTREHN